MAEKKPDAAMTMVSVTQFAALVELTVQRVYQLCQQNILPRIVDGNLPVIAGMQAYIRSCAKLVRLCASALENLRR